MSAPAAPAAAPSVGSVVYPSMKAAPETVSRDPLAAVFYPRYGAPQSPAPAATPPATPASPQPAGPAFYPQLAKAAPSAPAPADPVAAKLYPTTPAPQAAPTPNPSPTTSEPGKPATEAANAASEAKPDAAAETPEGNEPAHADPVAAYADLGIPAEHATRLVEHQQQASAAWADAVRSDSEVGGANFDTAVADAQSVIRQFGTPALRRALDQTGMGNHPETVRLLARIGRHLKGSR